MKIQKSLNTNQTDIIVSVGRGVIGAVPWIGPALNEILTLTIPNQRADRFQKYLELLSLELTNLVNKVDSLENEIKKSENVDFFEEGAYQSVRAVTEDRLKYIAVCVAKGIGKELTSKERTKRILRILSQVDNDEIRVLLAFSNNDHEEFSNLRPEPAVIGSDYQTLQENALYDNGYNNMISLGLIEKYYPFSKKGSSPEYDAFGKIKGEQKRISLLGRVFLVEIGLKESLH